ncbi:hypothetical protein D9611_013352 [Ephemerocybe angulata]|uniref:F-box domain-containing protein n=1 Tax=Ephemerocybe angulata TaxID=980116 RepID=A0A8H5CBN1_9AGAR|nr:hypothetical protein D9611_013352 [Tulosesus angulatus]
MMALLDLPTEILLQIIEYACASPDCTTVYSLCRTSKELWNLSRGHRFTSALVVGWEALLTLEKVYSTLPEDSEERRKGIVNMCVDLPCLFQAAYPEGPIWCEEYEEDDSPYVFGKDYDLVTTEGEDEGEEDGRMLSDGTEEVEMPVVPGTSQQRTEPEGSGDYEGHVGDDGEHGEDQDGVSSEQDRSDSEGYEGDSDSHSDDSSDSESELESRELSASAVSKLWAELVDVMEDAEKARIPSILGDDQQGPPSNLELYPSEGSDADPSYAPSESISDRVYQHGSMSMAEVYRMIEGKGRPGELSTTDDSVLWDTEDDLEFASSLSISESEIQDITTRIWTDEELNAIPIGDGLGSIKPLDFAFLERDDRRSSKIEFEVYSALRRLLEANSTTLEVFTLHWKPQSDYHPCRLFPVLPKLRSLALYRHTSEDYYIGRAPGPYPGDNEDPQKALFPSIERLDYDCSMLRETGWYRRCPTLVMGLHRFQYATIPCKWVISARTHVHSLLPSSLKALRIHCTCEDFGNDREGCREDMERILPSSINLTIVHSVDIRQDWLDQLDSPSSSHLPFQIQDQNA